MVLVVYGFSTKVLPHYHPGLHDAGMAYPLECRAALPDWSYFV